MNADRGTATAQADLARMLADMDRRLEALQRELESVAIPVVPGVRDPGPDASHARSEEGPAAQSPTPRRSAVPDLHAREVDAPSDEPVPRALATPRAAGPPRGRLRSRNMDLQPVEPAEADAPETSPSPSPPRRSARRTAAGTKARSGTPGAAEPKDVQASGLGDDFVRETIRTAEQDARAVVEEARRRIDEIASVTRSTLERSLAAAPQPTGEGRAASSRRVRVKRSTRPESRTYDGELTIEAGPFGDLEQLNAFEDALAAVAGIEDVHIHTFDSDRALFGARAIRPTKVIAELQARAPQVVLLEAGDNEIRLQLARDDTGRPTR